MKVVFVLTFLVLCVLTTYTRSDFITADINSQEDDVELDEDTSLERVKRSADADAGRGGSRGGSYRSPSVRTYRAPRNTPRVARRTYPKTKTPVKKKPIKKTPKVKPAVVRRRASYPKARIPTVRQNLRIRNNGKQINRYHSGSRSNTNKPKTMLLIIIGSILAIIHYNI